MRGGDRKYSSKEACALFSAPQRGQNEFRLAIWIAWYYYQIPGCPLIQQEKEQVVCGVKAQEEMPLSLEKPPEVALIGAGLGWL